MQEYDEQPRYPQYPPQPPYPQQSPQELEAQWGNKKLKLRGSEVIISVIGFIVCSALSTIGYALWTHMTKEKEDQVQSQKQAAEIGASLTAAIKELTTEQRHSTQAQRENTCLLSLSQNKREAEFQSVNGLCKRLSRNH